LAPGVTSARDCIAFSAATSLASRPSLTFCASSRST